MIGNEKVSAVIAAAGSSQRMDGVDKIFALLEGEPVLARVVTAFQECLVVDDIVIVLNQPNVAAGKMLVAEHGWSKVADVCEGGARRQDSVINGLGRLAGCQWVLIHDGARPLVTRDLIERGLEAARETGAAIAAVPVTDTIKVAGENLIVQGTPPRRSLWSVQTPQVFRFDIIDEAYRQLRFEVTDDSTPVERMGHKVKIYPGSYDNIKITTPDDLALAGILWRKHGR
ncbi:MAG: 2-C-methyl-D-erythritol 4-phosphate cytidylyltransferase [Chloroflexi bacterium RBG_16_57_8]|nr:MAG: 2-C-methyl-D-erythritol 4-phosphate cytidylyltransferase [Chloroflexi bacterium RBG_16_57_8]